MPADPSPAQSETSRANGARSQGPASPEGRQRAARNAERHGLCGGQFELRPEEQELLDALCADHTARYRVRTPDGLHMALALARTQLLQDRLDQIEKVVLEAALPWFQPPAEEEARRLPSLSTLVRYRHRLERRERELREMLEELRHELAASTIPAHPVRRSDPTPAPHSMPADATIEPYMIEPEPMAQLNRHERRRLESPRRKDQRRAA